MIGEVISHYRVLERLGEGGMGEVYLVEDLKLHRKAALKLIAADLTRDAERRQRFVQEATLAASIDHPHIAAIFDIDEAGGRTFIVMEYVQGRSLRELLRGGPLKPRRAIDLAIQVADALAKVHERGIVHRDLKPENILVADEGYAKIIDFGVAKLIDPLRRSGLADSDTMTNVQVRTGDGLVLGTMAYMSPEQAKGETIDARSDIFSFGAVLQEMLTGAPPFRRSSAAETLSAILTMPPAPVHVDAAGAETELQRVIRKCLVKEVGGRYQGMRDVVVDLRDAREAMGSGTTTAQKAAPAARWLTTRLQVAAAVAIVALLAAGAIWRSQQNAETPAAGTTTTARPAIAILPFEMIAAAPDSAWLAKGLPSMLVTGLAQTPDVEVVGPERLNDAARQMGASNLDAVERTRLSDVARRAGARFVVTGSLLQAGDELRIDARVEDLTTGGVRLAQSVRGKDAFGLADELALRIRSGFNVEPTRQLRKVAEMASGSIEAYRAYALGRDAIFHVRVEDAKRYLDQAIAADPDFALAYFQRAFIAVFEGRFDAARTDLSRAAEHIGRLSERDGLLVRSMLAAFEGRGDENVRLLESLVQKYPDTEEAHLMLIGAHAPLAGMVPDVARGMAAADRAVRALPASGGLRNAHGYALAWSGRFDEAIAAFNLYLKLAPSEPNALDSLAEGYLVSGDAANAVETYGRAIAAGHSSSREGRAWSYAVVGRYGEALGDLPDRSLLRAVVLSRVGRYRDAHADLSALRASSARDGQPIGIVATDLLEARIALERADCRTAGAAADRAVSGAADIPAVVRTGLRVLADVIACACEARRGDTGRAQARLTRVRELARLSAPAEKWWVHGLEGEMALAAGDPQRATGAFAAGLPPTMPFERTATHQQILSIGSVLLRDGPARAAAAAGRVDEAIALYRTLVTPGRDRRWTAVLEARHVLALARLLDKAGRRDEARAEYQRFLTLWKDADRDLPEIAEARSRL